MKKLFLIFICILLTGCVNQNKDIIFSLEDKYYEKATYLDITSSELDKLIDNKESFAVFIYQPLCNTSYEFSLILDEFINKYNITLYKIEFSNIKDTKISKYIKYYPSLAIFYKGDIINYLDANSNEDIDYYKNIDSFESWFSKNVILKNNIDTNPSNDNIDNDIDNNIDLTNYNLTYSEDKVNIYLFWGNGCPHCEKELEFLESIQEEYGFYFKLNKFEVWYDEDNEELLNKFSKLMNDNVSGVPYTIIGNKSFSGFNDNTKDEIITAIKEQYNNSYDVYFSNIN